MCGNVVSTATAVERDDDEDGGGSADITAPCRR
jgi:hypothetical protein